MLDFDETEHLPMIALPEESVGERSPMSSLKERKMVFPPPIDPALCLKWGLALLGEEKAKEYLTWLQTRLNADSH